MSIFIFYALFIISSAFLVYTIEFKKEKKKLRHFMFAVNSIFLVSLINFYPYKLGIENLMNIFNFLAMVLIPVLIEKVIMLEIIRKRNK